MPDRRSDEAGQGRADAAGTMAAGRAAEYLDIWERAGRRLLDGEYHSEDLVDDWFSCLGMWVRDSVAITTVSWRSVADDPPATTDGSSDAR